MTTLPDILRGFRPAGEELLRITQCVTEPYAAVDPRHLDVQVAAGGAARLVVLHTSPELSALRCTLGEGARLELTELFTAEAFAEVPGATAASRRCSWRAPMPPTAST